METIDEAAFNYVDLKLTETKDRKCLPSNFFAADVEKAFKAGALWMAKQHANEISECTEKSFKSGVEYMKRQILQLLDDRMTSNLANEGNSAGGRYYSAKMEEDVDIITEVKKL